MNDAAAIEKCQNGEHEAFRFLVESYQNQAVAHAVAILGSREDALDAVQEAFVDAFQAIKNFDGERRFYPWFYVLLRNRCFKFLERRKNTESFAEIEIIAAPENVPDEEKFALEKALRSLAADEREIITLKYFDGLSYEELAERLQIPRGTVMSKLFYARKNLKKQLTGKFN